MRTTFQLIGTFAVWFLLAYGWQSPPGIQQVSYQQQDDSDTSAPADDSDDESLLISKYVDC